MLSEEKLKELLEDMESDRIERTISFSTDKLGMAICAFSNDFPNHRDSGYLLLGVNDDGSAAAIKITDENLLQIGNIKSNGNVLPQPSIVISPIFNFGHGDIVVVEVKPSKYPPVRFNGKCWIRVGPRKSLASVDEERILIERRAGYAKTYDLVPALGSSLEDLSIEHFKLSYLPLAIDKETLEVNGRSVEVQMASLRFFDLKENCPTNAGILVFGIHPLYYLPGAYIQYVKFDGEDMVDNVIFEKEFSGPLIAELNVIDDFIKANIVKEKPLRMGSFQEKLVTNYPYWALRELVMNAIMHRSYETNSPIHIYEFSNRIEIHNSGGLYGDVNASNFPNASGYRNVVLAEALKRLGYVNRFNYGVKRAIHELEINGNGEPEFDFTSNSKFKVTIYIHQELKG
jgi:ATP-dependent DNA helicase RecG